MFQRRNWEGADRETSSASDVGIPKACPKRRRYPKLPSDAKESWGCCVRVQTQKTGTLHIIRINRKDILGYAEKQSIETLEFAK